MYLKIFWVVQEVLGHKDISTTLDVYTDVTKEQARSEFSQLDEKLKINATAMMALAESEK